MSKTPPWAPLLHAEECEYVNTRPPGSGEDITLCRGCASFLAEQSVVPVRARNIGPDFDHVGFEAPRLIALSPMGLDTLLSEMPENSAKAYPGVMDYDGVVRAVLVTRADIEAALSSHYHHLLLERGSDARNKL